MNRWSVRIVGIMILLLFLFILSMLRKQLEDMKEQQELERPAATSTKSP